MLLTRTIPLLAELWLARAVRDRARAEARAGQETPRPAERDGGDPVEGPMHGLPRDRRHAAGSADEDHVGSGHRGRPAAARRTAQLDPQPAEGPGFPRQVDAPP